MRKSKHYRHRKFRFTVSSVKALQPETKIYECRDTSTKGLILRVTPAGVKTYYITYRTQDSDPKRYRLGLVQEFQTPEAARIAAGVEWDRIRNKGADPQAERLRKAEEKRSEADAHTLKSFIDDEYKDYAGLHLRGADATIKRLKSAFADLLDTKLPEITVTRLTDWRGELLAKGRTPPNRQPAHG